MAKILIVLGTRPEIIKLSPVIRECQKRNLDFKIVHSNQHYTESMDKLFFEELKLPEPDYHLGIGSATHAVMTARIMTSLEPILDQEKPEWVIVQGDTNTVLAAALTAVKKNIKVAHVEAGLRGYDRQMPEEINRVIVDHISEALFAPTQRQAEILEKEGIESSKIHLVGNTIVDAAYQNSKLAETMVDQSKFRPPYFVLTLHRPSNADSPEKLARMLTNISDLASEHQRAVYFPIHPRTRSNIEKFGLSVPANIQLLEPLGYLEMVSLMKQAEIILTDSGGLQEEACIFQVPCLTLRDSTERPETLDVGANILVADDREALFNGYKHFEEAEKNWICPFGDGHSAETIVQHIM